MKNLNPLRTLTDIQKVNTKYIKCNQLYFLHDLLKKRIMSMGIYHFTTQMKNKWKSILTLIITITFILMTTSMNMKKSFRAMEEVC